MRCLSLLLPILFFGALAAVEPLNVVTGNTVVQDLAQRIGGERIVATCLLQVGIDPHTYQPTPSDAKSLADAQLCIINGLGFEGWFEGLVADADFRGTVVIASAGVEVLTMDAEDHHGHAGADPAHDPAHDHAHDPAGVADPHAFNSLTCGIVYAENIRDALSTADPEGAALYRANATALISELRSTDAWAKQLFASIPKSQRIIITNHDALQYFARDYAFTILAPNTALEDSEPSPQQVAALVTLIREQGVAGIFLEYAKNHAVIEQIAREAGVATGGELYLDGLGPADSAAGTYVGMFRTNVQTIHTALTR